MFQISQGKTKERLITLLLLVVTSNAVRSNLLGIEKCGKKINNENNGGTNSCGSPPEDAICLKQKDFEYGTKIIDTPGNYKLCEDIVFHANGPESGSAPSENSFDPDLSIYEPATFGLGFFAAISISAPNVSLYLNCYSIKQSEGHALFQRFFAIIELANSPFISGVGPANFINQGFQPARNVLIKGPGTIGRSSHHGIHGNNNAYVKITDIQFEDFEVAAVALNNVDTAIIENCNIHKNRQDVPVIGAFSAARNLRSYAKALKQIGYSMDINGKHTSADELYENLIISINKVYEDVVLKKNLTGGFIDPKNSPNEHYLFDNPFRVVDGPCYAFVIHGHGPAVGGYGFALNPDDSMTSSNITIINNKIKDVKCWTNETPAAVFNETVQNDVRGSVIQFISSIDNKPLAINTDGTYRRNVIADLQIMIAKAFKEGKLTTSPELQSVSTINDMVIEWASKANQKINPEYRCNGDSMHHVSKGMVMLRLEDTKGFTIKDNSFDSIENLSKASFGSSFGVCADYHAGTSVEDKEDQQGANIRVISISAVAAYQNGTTNSIQNNQIANVTSDNGEIVIGIDIQGESESIAVDHNVVDLHHTAQNNPFDNLISLRIRQFVDSNGSVKVGDTNSFRQEVQQLNTGRRLGDRKRKAMLFEAHKNVNKIEWEVGGCPFSRGQ